MGIIATVYRAANRGDCTNGGMTAKADRVVIINADGPFEPSENMPAAAIIKGPGGNAIIVPMGKNCYAPGMFGGNYAGTCDARFGNLAEKVEGKTGICGASILPVHDRFE